LDEIMVRRLIIKGKTSWLKAKCPDYPVIELKEGLDYAILGVVRHQVAQHDDWNFRDAFTPISGHLVHVGWQLQQGLLVLPEISVIERVKRHISQDLHEQLEDCAIFLDGLATPFLEADVLLAVFLDD
jgi:hypothetical protein